MSKKMTAAEVEKTLLPKLQGFKESAAQLKESHVKARQAIKDDPRTSDFAKKEKLDPQQGHPRQARRHQGRPGVVRQGAARAAGEGVPR